MGKILASEFNAWYSRLTTVQSRFGITQTSGSTSAGTKANASDMNTLLTRINSLRTNTYLNYASQADMATLTVGTKIQQTKATEIDNHLRAFEQVCANCVNNATTSGTSVPSFATTTFTVSPISNTTTSFSQSCQTNTNTTFSDRCSTFSTFTFTNTTNTTQTKSNSTFTKSCSTNSDSCSTNDHKTNGCRTYSASGSNPNFTTSFNTNKTCATNSKSNSTFTDSGPNFSHINNHDRSQSNRCSTFSERCKTSTNTTFSQTMFFTASSGFAVQRG